MSHDYDSAQEQKFQFERHCKWFEQEMDELFAEKNGDYSVQDYKIANLLLNKLSTKFNEYPEEENLYTLRDTLNRIEFKYPALYNGMNKSRFGNDY